MQNVWPQGLGYLRKTVEKNRNLTDQKRTRGREFLTKFCKRKKKRPKKGNKSKNFYAGGGKGTTGREKDNFHELL